MSIHPMQSQQRSSNQLSLFQRDPEKSIAERRYENVAKQLPVELSWFKTKPFEHQMTSFLFGLRHPKAAILVPIGGGKTHIAINLLRYRIEQGQVRRALIVAPLSVLSTWEDELKKHSDLNYEVMRGSRIEKIGTLLAIKEPPEVIICGYESVRIYEKGFRAKKFDIVIADESSKIKSPRAKVSHAFWRAFQNVPYKLILTGLMLPNNIMDAYSPYRFLDPSVFGTVYQHFKECYGRFGGFHGYVFQGPRNLSEFRRKLFSIGITFRKEELFDLPPRTYEMRTVQLSSKERSAYNSMKDNFLAELSSVEKIVATNVLTQFLRLHQITSGHLTDGDHRITEIGTSKFEAFTDYMETAVLGTESKVLVFVQFLHTLYKVTNWAEKMKLNPAVIYGAVKDEDRGTAIRKLQNDDSCRIFVGQISTASLGINLTKANIAIFLESDFSYGNRNQCEGRNYRLGQTRKVTVIDFVVPDSIDTYILSALKRKENFSDQIMRPERILNDGKRGLF